MSLSDFLAVARFSFYWSRATRRTLNPAEHHTTIGLGLYWGNSAQNGSTERLCLQSQDDAEYELPDTQAHGSWDLARDDANEEVFTSKAGTARSESDPPKEVIESFSEWEFCRLPSQTNSDAYSLAYHLIRESIFNWGRNHFFDTCDRMWDAVCDVNIERVDMNVMFGRHGMFTKELDAAKQEAFARIAGDLPHLRHRVAHPTETLRGGASLQFVCQHISYARTMARLLDDQPVVQEIDALLNSLQEQGRNVLQLIKSCKTLAGCPEGQGWPRHCERLFHAVDVVKSAYVAEPATPYEWRDHYTWKRVPSFLREASSDWADKYDLPGVRKPGCAV